MRERSPLKVLHLSYIDVTHVSPGGVVIIITIINSIIMTTPLHVTNLMSAQMGL